MSEGVKGRERVIKDIETIEQAVKAENDVEIGYHGVIDENIAYWLAVEEDIIESYAKLMKQTSSKKSKTTLAKVINDSKNHIRMLTSIKKAFAKIMADEQRHAKLLEGIADEFNK